MHLTFAILCVFYMCAAIGVWWLLLFCSCQFQELKKTPICAGAAQQPTHAMSLHTLLFHININQHTLYRCS